MLNPDAEINRLRGLLVAQRKDFNEIDMVCNAASKDINEVILDIVTGAMSDAVAYSIELGAEQFLNDVDIVNMGGSYYISTRSGKTNFSEPATPMLHNLLKNAKTAKDGSRYKVIPLNDSSSKKTAGRSIFEDQQSIQGKIASARAALQDELGSGQSTSANTMTDSFRQMVRQAIPMRQSFYSRSTNREANPVFRTASSKQDPNINWVRPAKELDMTGYLMDLNTRMQRDIQTSVISIISEYERII